MNALIIILSILCAVSSGIAIYSRYKGYKILFFISKPVTTILIILLSILFGRDGLSSSNTLIYMGLLFCLCGDVLLMLQDKFIHGLASFLVAHFLFFSFFILKTETVEYYLVIPIVITGITVYRILFKHLGKLKLPVLVYFVIILVMVFYGINLYITSFSTASKLIALAVILFGFSDANLAFDKFMKTYKIAEFLILSTYFLSIFLIALSLRYF